MQKQRCSFREFRNGAPWLLIAALASLILMLAPLSRGQAVSATLLGNVTDNTGAAVPNADGPDSGKRHRHRACRGYE